MKRPPLLLVDDEESISTPLAAFLEARGFPVTVANDGETALAEAASGRYPVVLSDIYIDRVTGLDVLRAAKAACADCAVILMTAKGSLRTTVEAEAAGVFDYLAKPVKLDHLLETVERACRAVTPARKPAAEEDLPDLQMIGSSAAMVELYKGIASAARSDSTTLILGETGAGKERVAEAIHNHSRRAGRPFVPVDCAAIPENLWESELFGAVRGAFTGADRDRRGVLREAASGTVFLDEIGEIPPSFQSKLLRLLQTHEFRPVGAAAPVSVDVRILAATNRPLDRMVAGGSFREDLYHRLNVLRVTVPPLRDRREDIPALARHFLRAANERHNKSVTLAAEAVELLVTHAWPGNVRELENAMERLVAMFWATEAGAEEVRRVLAPPSSPTGQGEAESLDDAERRHVVEAIRQSGGNMTAAAERLGIQRRTLYKKLERWGISRGPAESGQGDG